MDTFRFGRAQMTLYFKLEIKNVSYCFGFWFTIFNFMHNVDDTTLDIYLFS